MAFCKATGVAGPSRRSTYSRRSVRIRRSDGALAAQEPICLHRTGHPSILAGSEPVMFVPISNSVVAGRYELIDEIGRGGMGVVWRARQANLGIECAVKFIHAAQAHEPEIRRRFVREARAAASLKSPNSVHILDVDEWQGTLFIAMELLSGESLEARLARERSLSPELTLDIIEQVARGLNKAHAAQLVHRDLKPENIFLLDDEPLLVKILDFGIAKRSGAASGLHTTSGVLVGTPGYMSPEQADGGKDVDYRSDLWSLAVVAFRCLTGKAPFDGEGLGQVLVKVMTGPIPSPRSVRPSLPARVDEWWFRVIQRDPALRPPSATALASGLREALASVRGGQGADVEPVRATGVESLQPTLQPVSSSPSRRGRSRRLYALAFAALLPLGWLVLERWSAPTSSGVPDIVVSSERAALQGQRAPTPAAAASATAGASVSRASPQPASPGIAPVVAAADGGASPEALAPPAGKTSPAPRPSTIPASSRPATPAPAPPRARTDAKPAAPSAAPASRAPEPKPTEQKPTDPKSRPATPDDDPERSEKPEQPEEPDVFKNPWPARQAPADDPRLGF